MLWRAVRRLKETDQQVIYLRYFLELPVAEAAQVLEVAPGTVKSRLYRALKRLRAVVEGEFPMLRDGRRRPAGALDRGALLPRDTERRCRHAPPGRGARPGLGRG